VSKFQELLDSGEAQVAARTVQQPSDAFLEREKRFLQQEARLFELRKIRLAASAAAPGMRTYDVVRHNGSWRILYLGRHSAGFASQQAAISAAIEKAKHQIEMDRPARVRLNRTDGQIWPVDLATGNAAATSRRPSTSKDI
jgi:hypothetical protein